MFHSKKQRVSKQITQKARGVETIFESKSFLMGTNHLKDPCHTKRDEMGIVSISKS